MSSKGRLSTYIQNVMLFLAQRATSLTVITIEDSKIEDSVSKTGKPVYGNYKLFIL